jgi:hypothetical protein
MEIGMVIIIITIPAILAALVTFLREGRNQEE